LNGDGDLVITAEEETAEEIRKPSGLQELAGPRASAFSNPMFILTLITAAI
jgi:hypothetical protein